MPDAGGNKEDPALILIGIGSNLGAAGGTTPRETCEAALHALGRAGLQVLRRSRWFETAPVPVSDQPWFVNGVAELSTELTPDALLDVLHRVEADFGRVRRVMNEARVLDLDLLDYDGAVRDAAPVLPHPRLHQRAFVLLPLKDLAPGWRHPRSGKGIDELIKQLDPAQEIRPLGNGTTSPPL